MLDRGIKFDHKSSMMALQLVNNVIFIMWCKDEVVGRKLKLTSIADTESGTDTNHMVSPVYFQLVAYKSMLHT